MLLAGVWTPNEVVLGQAPSERPFSYEARAGSGAGRSAAVVGDSAATDAAATNAAATNAQRP